MDPILAVVLACEVGFWVLVVLGLAARYLLRRRHTGGVLLALTPAVDVVLLVAVIVHLRAGGAASFFHGLAALYLGISVAYGRSMVAWADTRFAHRFAGGPAPVKRYGRDYARDCWRDVLRTTVAAAIAAVLVGLLLALETAPSGNRPLLGLLALLGLWLGIDLVWAISYTVAPKKQPSTTN